MNLFLAFFWFALGAGIQIFWSRVEPYLRHDIVPVNRTAIGLLFFLLFSYNLIRWRISRFIRQARRKDAEALERRRRAAAAIDPEFDISDQNPAEGQETKPPPV